jgi:acetolactate synthase-1/2/3 large subunit
MTTVSTNGIRKSNRRWQSDVIVDLVKRYGFPYVALNPGASFRGLHDSLVNYGENEPPMLLCNHEKIAVQIAHGYARASGQPMIAIVHDVVGLLHAPMGIYYAYLDRAPVFIIGATGPLAEPKRRPFIDWIHSANVQGEAIRHIVKWDYQPAAIDGVPDAFARAYSIMMSCRQGPICATTQDFRRLSSITRCSCPRTEPPGCRPRQRPIRRHSQKRPTRWLLLSALSSSRISPPGRLLAGTT